MNDKTKKIIKGLYPYVVIIIVVILLRSFIVTPAIVNGNSMLPNLKNNNIVLLNKLDYKLNDIKRFDVVVIKYNNEKLIKRVIGLPGEHVEYKKNNLYVDGIFISENFKHDDTADFRLELLGYLKIPGDKYFVVGDNRNNSADSRMIGLIDREDILGSTSYKLLPPGKIK